MNERLCNVSRGLQLLLPVVSLTTMPVDFARGQTEEAATGTAPATSTAHKQAAANQTGRATGEFQLQELMLAKSGTWIFKPGEPPRILWRATWKAVRRLRVQWASARALVRRRS